MKTKVRYVYTVTGPEIEVTSKQLDRQTKFFDEHIKKEASKYLDSVFAGRENITVEMQVSYDDSRNGAWLEKKDWVFPLDKLPNFD